MNIHRKTRPRIPIGKRDDIEGVNRRIRKGQSLRKGLGKIGDFQEEPLGERSFSDNDDSEIERCDD